MGVTRRCFCRRCFFLALLSSPGLWGPLPAKGKDIGMNMEFASRLVLGHADGNWLSATETPALHRSRLMGQGQVLGLGDTGVDGESCSFKDTQHQVPFSTTSASHRKIAGYFAVGGDNQDSARGHGTHIAGIMVGQNPAASSDHGIAPEARLVVVDVEKAGQPGEYQVPDTTIDVSYFDLFRNAQANIVCSPWSYDQSAVGVKDALNLKVDIYAWNHPEFLAVFPSGNAGEADADLSPMSPCVAKNVLCVGASYNARQKYLQQPSFVHTALQLGSDACLGEGRGACAQELQAFTGLFGATKPSSRSACRLAVEECHMFRTACPDCAFDAGKLAAVADAPAAATSPLDGCTTLQGFPRGRVCVVQRGTCSFLLKARHCSEAGGVGMVLVNSPGQSLVVMDGEDAEIDSLGLILPVVAVSKGDEAVILEPSRRLTFPVVSGQVDPRHRVPYSRYGTASGRAKPDVVVPGDGISSTAVDVGCGFKQMSGTSQSCGVAAGAAGLVREYLAEWADPFQARLPTVWASTLRASLVAAAEVDRSSVSSASTVLLPEVGFGLPALASLLPMPPGPGLIAVQSLVDVVPQRFCLSLSPSAGAGALAITLAWTDPPSQDGSLVHDLDLEVMCDVSSWQPSRGNGGTGFDRTNTVEKVALLGFDSFASGACIVTVAANGVSAASPQPFSLVVAGPFVLRSDCGAPVRAPHCVHGTAEQMADVWRCRCFFPYVGVDCNQEAANVPLLAAASPRGADHLRPWQWSFFALPVPCGAGRYQLILEGGSDPELLQMALSFGHLQVAGTPGVASAAGVVIVTETQALEAAHATTAVVDVAASAIGDAEVFLTLALQWQGRSGPHDVVLRWSSDLPNCVAQDAVGPASSGFPVGLIVGLCAMVGTAIVSGRMLLKCFRSRSSKVQPMQLQRGPGGAWASNAPFTDEVPPAGHLA